MARMLSEVRSLRLEIRSRTLAARKIKWGHKSIWSKFKDKVQEVLAFAQLFCALILDSFNDSTPKHLREGQGE